MSDQRPITRFAPASHRVRHPTRLALAATIGLFAAAATATGGSWSRAAVLVAVPLPAAIAAAAPAPAVGALLALLLLLLLLLLRLLRLLPRPFASCGDATTTWPSGTLSTVSSTYRPWACAAPPCPMDATPRSAAALSRTASSLR